MIAIPFYIVLFIYLLFLCVFLIFSLINFYHIVSTSSITISSFMVTFFVFALAMLTLFYTWQTVIPIDWSQGIVLFDSNWFN